MASRKESKVSTPERRVFSFRRDVYYAELNEVKFLSTDLDDLSKTFTFPQLVLLIP